MPRRTAAADTAFSCTAPAATKAAGTTTRRGRRRRLSAYACGVAPRGVDVGYGGRAADDPARRGASVESDNLHRARSPRPVGRRCSFSWGVQGGASSPLVEAAAAAGSKKQREKRSGSEPRASTHNVEHGGIEPPTS